MKRMGELMKEMGFNPESSDSVKESFIRHLMRASEGVSPINPSKRLAQEIKEKKVGSAGPKYEQLSFNLDGASDLPNGKNKEAV